MKSIGQTKYYELIRKQNSILLKIKHETKIKKFEFI